MDKILKKRYEDLKAKVKTRADNWCGFIIEDQQST